MMMKLNNPERFYGNADKSSSNGCWNWKLSKDRAGYGFASFNGKTIKAHRLSWIFSCGDIPQGLLVLHKCDNPSCVNPTHLWLGTTLDNARDRNAKDRQARGERQGLAKLTSQQVSNIREDDRPRLVVAAEYGISLAQVYKIRTAYAWAHIPSMKGVPL